MSKPYIPYEEISEKIPLPKEKYLLIKYYADLELKHPTNRFCAKYREINVCKNHPSSLAQRIVILSSKFEENPFYDPTFFEKLKSYQEKGFKELQNSNMKFNFF